jgi:hypothetical protein
MLIVKLMGGLGNQMFQYAHGRCLSLKYNVPLKLDLTFLKKRDWNSDFVYRDYDLDLFNVHSDFDFTSEGEEIHITEPHFHYSKKIDEFIGEKLINGASVLVEGYWQSPLYFKEFEPQIREDFKLIDSVEFADEKIRQMLYFIRSSNSVLINVRRTDYLKTDFFGVKGIEYISKAKSLIDSKVKDAHYFIFSDDVEWCRENIVIDNMTIVDHSYKGNKFGYYFQLMANCKHFIIPNSSFAWWSAWMNIRKDKIVVAPKQWFADRSINTNDLIPSDWLRISDKMSIAEKILKVFKG